ncbi:hypothetical protein CMI37_15825 [Candidatus Pacearchaeota archaeon]|nr:hypothetical protein [Candidatus Pacearchaeota archaeon]|tara:strand:+ start:2468 stop:4117 length:1650 start_codon:yes stop_codon:yes gene_type:complete
MAESVSLTAQAQLGIRAEVENAIQNVLSNDDPSMSTASAQDILNLDNALKIKFKKLTEDIQKGLEDVANNIVSAIGGSSRESAEVASILHGDETESPLNRMASTLDEIHAFLVDKFKPTGLGSEDDNKGMLDRIKSDLKSEEKKEKDTKTSTGSAWLGGTIVAATLMSIKDYLEETWAGLAQRFLKPFVAVQLAIKGLPKSLTRLSLNFQRFTSKIGILVSKTFPRLSKIIKTLFKPIQFLVTKVKGLSRSIISAVKNFKFSKFFAPLTKWLSKLGGTAGFGKLFKWMSPIGGLLKKLAFPITLVIEAFEAFKMIFVGSFSKNAQDLSDSISKKGILGRAWYGFTHMFQTIATFGYELVETFKAVIDIVPIFWQSIKDTMKAMAENIAFAMDEYLIFPLKKILSWGVIGTMTGVEDPQIERDRIEAEKAKQDPYYKFRQRMTEELKTNPNMSGMEQSGRDKVLDARINRAKEYGIIPKPGESYDEFKARINAAKAAKKINESPALPTPQLDTLRGTRSNRQFSVGSQTANAISITNQVKLPSVAEVINE